jgi:hypothetical protein
VYILSLTLVQKYRIALYNHFHSTVATGHLNTVISAHSGSCGPRAAPFGVHGHDLIRYNLVGKLAKKKRKTPKPPIYSLSFLLPRCPFSWKPALLPSSSLPIQLESSSSSVFLAAYSVGNQLFFLLPRSRLNQLEILADRLGVVQTTTLAIRQQPPRPVG